MFHNLFDASEAGKTVNAFIYELIYSETRNLLLATDLSIQEDSSEDELCQSGFIQQIL